MTAEGAQRAAKTRTFRKRWTESCDAIKKRGLVVHDMKRGQRGPELAALEHLLTAQSSLVTELQVGNLTE